jgi:predicted RND superfamily exporter protein
MNQYLRAGALTAGMMAIVVAVTGFFHWLSQVITPDMVPTIVIGAGITACVICIYTVFLAQIRYDGWLKRMVDKK